MLQPSNLFAFGAQYFAEKRSECANDTKKEEPQVAKAEEEAGNAFERAVVAANYQELQEAVYGELAELWSSVLVH